MRELRAKVSKLLAMRPAEIGGRLAYRVHLARERRTIGRVPRPAAAAGLRDSLRADLARRPDWKQQFLHESRAARERWFMSLAEPDTTCDLLRSRFGDGTGRAQQRARGVLAGRVEIFGQSQPLGLPVDWHTAPGRARGWPALYHADIDILDSDGRGDVKEIWELNRHQALLDLARLWLLEGDAQYARAISALVLSWREQNPYGFGINWAGPLEVAYRALSWMWAYTIIGETLDDDVRCSWLEGFRDHARYLHEHAEAFSSPYNHLIGEAAVLYMLGVLFPEFRDSPRWRRRGRHLLESRLPAQFYGDGGSVEQAVGYHHATLGFYLLAALLGERNGERLAPPVWTAIERGIAFSMTLMQPDGRQPALGDNDDARPILFDRSDGWDYRHFQSIGAVLFARGDFKHAAGRLHEDALWLLGPGAATAFDSLAPVEPPLSTALPDSGYVVLRSGAGRDADYVCFDCGEQAGGLRTDGVPSAAHGHADCLAVVAHIAGQPVLVDAGFFTYNGEEAWERFFRETAAHNTVRIDGRDQATHLAKMAWSEVPRATLEGWQATPGAGWAAGSHDGYARGTPPVTHRRGVWLTDDGVLVLVDDLDAIGTHAVELVFQCAPGLDLVLDDARATVAGPALLAWHASFPVRAAVVRGGPAPQDGWVAEALGTRTPAARLVLSGQIDGPARILTVLADRRRWSSIDRDTSGPGCLDLALRVAGAHRSRVVASSSLPFPAPPAHHGH